MKQIFLENQCFNIDNIELISLSSIGTPKRHNVTLYHTYDKQTVLYSTFDEVLAKKCIGGIMQTFKKYNNSNMAQIGSHIVNLDYVDSVDLTARSLDNNIFYQLDLKTNNGYVYNLYRGNADVANKLKFDLLKSCKNYRQNHFSEQNIQ